MGHLNSETKLEGIDGNVDKDFITRKQAEAEFGVNYDAFRIWCKKYHADQWESKKVPNPKGGGWLVLIPRTLVQFYVQNKRNYKPRNGTPTPHKEAPRRKSAPVVKQPFTEKTVEQVKKLRSDLENRFPGLYPPKEEHVKLDSQLTKEIRSVDSLPELELRMIMVVWYYGDPKMTLEQARIAAAKSCELIGGNIG